MKNLKKISLPVTGMSCAVCAQSIETLLSSKEGVVHAAVNFADKSVMLEYNDSLATLADLKKTIKEIGYDLIIDENITQEGLENIELKRYKILQKKLITASVLSLPVVALSMFFMHLFHSQNWLLMALSLPVLLYSGSDFFSNAFKKIKHGETNMDTLVALSTGIAFLYSAFNTIFPEILLKNGMKPHVYFESATVIITFILLGKFLEERSRTKASVAIKKLIGLQPKNLVVYRDVNEIEITIKDVLLNDIILVKPGAKIPVDGKVSSGDSFIDESMITGEPVPIHKTAEALVFAGTINQKGSLQIIAKKIGSETLLSQIIQQVREAQSSKPPIQKLADKIAGIFVPVVLGIALLTFLLWMLLAPSPAFSHALLATITVLIIACPCALGLATPTALIAGVGRGAEHGILVKNAESLEVAHKINAIVFDKTGTLTKGKPEVTESLWLDELDRKNLVHILFAIEQRSEHPLAEAICRHFQFHDLKNVSIELFESLTGRGVKAKINDKWYFVGNHQLIDENNINSAQFIDAPINIFKHSSGETIPESKTLIYFADESNVLAKFVITDEIKPSSIKAVEELKKMGIEVFMLTGDNKEAAASIAVQTGIDNFRAEMLPSEKGDFIKDLQKKGYIVAMAGDGINDTQALAQANLGIAMASGSDISMESAGITLLKSDLQHIVNAIKLSIATVKIIRQNLFWAFFYNLIAIPIAAGILYPFNGFLLSPMIAGAAMAMSSVSVVTNSLRLRKIKL